jgi:hypothetical protein
VNLRAIKFGSVLVFVTCADVPGAPVNVADTSTGIANGETPLTHDVDAKGIFF